MARKDKQPSHDNQYSGLLWLNKTEWRGCFCLSDIPNAKADCRIEGKSVSNLVVLTDEGQDAGSIVIKNIANPTSALTGTGVYISADGSQRVGLAVFYDELAGRYRIAKQRPRPALV
jgi:hypothetical protein